MKIQCSACETAEAEVLCCADEAALCLGCDEKIHAAPNKLASRHHRVPLSTSSSPMPKCDICQETVSYFFCLEDRALLCRKCDVDIHTANSYVSGHQRFLLTGVKVGLGATEPGGSSTMNKSNCAEKVNVASSQSMSRSGATVPFTDQTKEAISGHIGGVGSLVGAKVPFTSGPAPGSTIPGEFLGLTNFNQNRGSIHNGSSKTDEKRLGDSEWSQILRTTEEELFNDEWSTPDDVSWTVPQILSSPPASGLYLPRNTRKTISNVGIFPPNIGCPVEDFRGHQSNPISTKRLRR